MKVKRKYGKWRSTEKVEKEERKNVRRKREIV